MSSQEQQHPLNNTLYRSNLPDTPVPADTNLDLKIQTIKGTEPYTVGWVRTYKVDGKEVTVNWLYDGQGNQSPMNASSSRTIPGTNQILHFNGNSVGSTKNSAPDSSVQEYLVGAQSSETKGPYTEGFNLKADDSSLSIDALKKRKCRFENGISGVCFRATHKGVQNKSGDYRATKESICGSIKFS